MNPGDAFSIAEKAGGRPHVYVVLSKPDPHGRIVIVNWTSDGGLCDDCSCVLEVNDHPLITHRSLVFYLKAKLAPLAALQAAMRPLRPGDPAPARPVPSVTPALLARILAGAAASKCTPDNVRAVLRAQGLIR